MTRHALIQAGGLAVATVLGGCAGGRNGVAPTLGSPAYVAPGGVRSDLRPCECDRKA
jgi:hypothetical protein